MLGQRCIHVHLRHYPRVHKNVKLQRYAEHRGEIIAMNSLCVHSRAAIFILPAADRSRAVPEAAAD